MPRFSVGDPSPKSHSNWAGPPSERARNSTGSPASTRVTSASIAATGADKPETTSTDTDAESLPSSLATVSVTVNVPARSHDFEGDPTSEVVPSPNSQRRRSTSPDERSWKEIDWPISTTVVEKEKSATGGSAVSAATTTIARVAWSRSLPRCTLSVTS